MKTERMDFIKNKQKLHSIPAAVDRAERIL